MKSGERRDERRDDFVEHPNPPDELAQNVSKKIPFGRICPTKLQNLTVFSIICMIRIRFFRPWE